MNWAFLQLFSVSTARFILSLWAPSVSQTVQMNLDNVDYLSQPQVTVNTN